MKENLSGASYPELLTVSPSPHIRHTDTIVSVMTDVIIALVPALIWGVICFGIRAAVVVILSVASCVLSELIFQKLTRRRVTVGDCSAALTGLLLGLSLSSSVPYYLPVIGGVFAIVVAKQLFGGIGKNFMNPALAARVFLFAWPSEMNVFVKPFSRIGVFASKADVDLVAGATPLSSLKTGTLPDVSVTELVLGEVSGCIGEVSVVLLLLGAAYLLCRRVITWHIPVSYLGVVALLTLIFPRNADAGSFMLSQLFTGGLILGAFFMATDYSTSPITGRGKLIFGAGCGALTVLIRYFGGYPEGVSFAVLIMNSLVYYIDRVTVPRVFGGGAANG